MLVGRGTQTTLWRMHDILSAFWLFWWWLSVSSHHNLATLPQGHTCGILLANQILYYNFCLIVHTEIQSRERNSGGPRAIVKTLLESTGN